MIMIAESLEICPDQRASSEGQKTHVFPLFVVRAIFESLVNEVILGPFAMDFQILSCLLSDTIKKEKIKQLDNRWASGHYRPALSVQPSTAID